MRLLFYLLLFGLGLPAASVLGQQTPPQYKLTILGTLETYSKAYGLNNAGSIIGFNYLTNFGNKGFLYTGGTMVHLPTLAPNAINDSNIIVGSGMAPNGQPQAARHEGGATEHLGTLGGNSSGATGINATGAIIGTSTLADGASRGFLYENENMTDIGNFLPTDINSSGQIVGTSPWPDSQAVLFESGTMRNLEQIENASSNGSIKSRSLAINDAGQIVGDRGLSNETPFLYENGKMINLGIPPGAGVVSMPSARDINNSGVIVGGCGFVCFDRVMYLLDELVDSTTRPSGVIFLEPQAINNGGQIAGFAFTDAPNGYRAFLLTPISTPPIGKVAPPTISEGSGSYVNSVEVALACVTAGAKIRYTTDGTQPTASSTLYSRPLRFTGYTRLCVQAFREDLAPSATARALYLIVPPPLPTPNIMPGGGTFSEPVQVRITCKNRQADIRYTLDGSSPNHDSPIYHGPFVLDHSATITAMAFHKNFPPSDIASATFTMEARETQVATPVIAPSGGSFRRSVKVRLTCPTKGVEIRYSLDGKDPTESSIAYRKPITLRETTTVKAFARKAGFLDSEIVTTNFIEE